MLDVAAVEEAAIVVDVVGALDAALPLDVGFGPSPAVLASAAGLATRLVGALLAAGGSSLAAIAELAAAVDFCGGPEDDDVVVAPVGGDVAAGAALAASALPFLG